MYQFPGVSSVLMPIRTKMEQVPPENVRALVVKQRIGTRLGQEYLNTRPALTLLVVGWMAVWSSWIRCCGIKWQIGSTLPVWGPEAKPLA